MQEFISAPLLFFTVLFTSPPPSPYTQPPERLDGTAGHQRCLTPHTARSSFHPFGLQPLTATAERAVWGTFRWMVQSLPGPRLWKIQALAHTAPLQRLFSEMLCCFWQEGKVSAPSIFLLLLWIPPKSAIQSTKVAELSKELTAARVGGPAPPSPLLCPLLRVHGDVSQASSSLWATEDCSQVWGSWVTSQPLFNRGWPSSQPAPGLPLQWQQAHW